TYNDAGATASDNVDGNLTTSIATVSTVNTATVGNYSVTYNVSDVAGNVADQVSRVVNVTADVTSPVVTAPANITVAATGASGTDASVTAIAIFLSGATAADNVDPTLTITHNASAVLPLGANLITFSATDTAGNTGTDQATVTITDQTKPVITLVGSSPINVELGSTYNDAGATASDNVDGNLTTSIATVST
ncbi:MAG: immunoglobulin-like domain-containing protein, partial [Gammaproteobacteria bacterium]